MCHTLLPQDKGWTRVLCSPASLTWPLPGRLAGHLNILQCSHHNCHRRLFHHTHRSHSQTLATRETWTQFTTVFRGPPVTTILVLITLGCSQLVPLALQCPLWIVQGHLRKARLWDRYWSITLGNRPSKKPRESVPLLPLTCVQVPPIMALPPHLIRTSVKTHPSCLLRPFRTPTAPLPLLRQPLPRLQLPPRLPLLQLLKQLLLPPPPRAHSTMSSLHYSSLPRGSPRRTPTYRLSKTFEPGRCRTIPGLQVQGTECYRDTIVYEVPTSMLRTCK